MTSFEIKFGGRRQGIATKVAESIDPELNARREIAVGEIRAVAIDGDSETVS